VGFALTPAEAGAYYTTAKALSRYSCYSLRKTGFFGPGLSYIGFAKLNKSQIHKGPVIEEVLLDYPRLRTEWFPKYAPELNPAEQVWNEFKGHTANSLPLGKQDIRNSLHANKRRVRRSQDKLRSLILASKLPSPFE